MPKRLLSRNDLKNHFGVEVKTHDCYIALHMDDNHVVVLSERYEHDIIVHDFTTEERKLTLSERRSLGLIIEVEYQDLLKDARKQTEENQIIKDKANLLELAKKYPDYALKVVGYFDDEKKSHD